LKYICICLSDERAYCQPGYFTDFTCATWTCVLQACRATQLTTVCSCFSIMKSIYCGKHCIFVLSFTLILTEMQGVELPGFIGRLVHLYHGAILVFNSLLSSVTLLYSSFVLSLYFEVNMLSLDMYCSMYSLGY